MNTNALWDAINTKLSTIHARVYRNKSPQTPTYPIVVASIDSAMAVDPSVDHYLNVDVYEAANTSIRAAETLADSIQDGLDDLIISNTSLNAHLTLEQRQYVSNEDLIECQMINLRFVVRTYYK